MLIDLLETAASSPLRTAGVREKLHDPALTLVRYADLLKRLFGFYAVWEESALGVIPDSLRDFLTLRLRVPSLKRDLLALGVPAEEIVALPRCAEMPVLDPVPRLLGSMYMLENSAPAAEDTLRRLKQAGIIKNGGMRFVEGRNGESARYQAELREILALYSSPENDPLILEGAEQTALRFAAWLSAN